MYDSESSNSDAPRLSLISSTDSLDGILFGLVTQLREVADSIEYGDDNDKEEEDAFLVQLQYKTRPKLANNIFRQTSSDFDKRNGRSWSGLFVGDNIDKKT